MTVGAQRESQGQMGPRGLSADTPCDRDTLLRLYRGMVLIRRFEERVLELRQDHEIFGPVHPYIGQEAVAVGVCEVLDTEDRLTSTHRGHGHSLAKGADPGRMIAELFGSENGYCRGKGGSMHIADFAIGVLGANGVVGAGLPIAAGSALAALLDGGSVVTACFFGEGTAGAGPFHEALNLAVIWELPVVFVCENNGWSVNSRSDELLGAAAVSDLASAEGLPTRQVDGTDVLAVLDAARWGVDRARRREGPSFIEASTYRALTHAYRDAGLPDVRDSSDHEPWADLDSIERCRHELSNRGWLTESDDRELLASVDSQLDDAVEFARNSPMPTPASALEDLFSEV